MSVWQLQSTKKYCKFHSWYTRLGCVQTLDLVCYQSVKMDIPDHREHSSKFWPHKVFFLLTGSKVISSFEGSKVLVFTWVPFWGIKIALCQVKIVFFSAKFSLVTPIMFDRFNFKVSKPFLASSQHYKLKISLKTRENTQNWIIHEPYVNEHWREQGRTA